MVDWGVRSSKLLINYVSLWPVKSQKLVGVSSLKCANSSICYYSYIQLPKTKQQLLSDILRFYSQIWSKPFKTIHNTKPSPYLNFLHVRPKFKPLGLWINIALEKGPSVRNICVSKFCNQNNSLRMVCKSVPLDRTHIFSN